MGRILRVLFDFNAQYKDELSIQKGDLINVINHSQASGSWLYGETNGCKGWFPENFTEPFNKADVSSSKIAEIKVIERLSEIEKELYTTLNILKTIYLDKISPSLSSLPVTEMCRTISTYKNSFDRLKIFNAIASQDESEYIIHFSQNLLITKKLFHMFSKLNPQVINFLRDFRSQVTLLLQADDVTFSLSKILTFLEAPVQHIRQVISIFSETQYQSKNLTRDAKQLVTATLEECITLCNDHAEECRSRELALHLLSVPPFSKNQKIGLNDISSEHGEFKLASKMIMSYVNEDKNEKDLKNKTCCILMLFADSLFVIQEISTVDDYIINAYLPITADWIVTEIECDSFNIAKTKIGDICFQTESQRLKQRWITTLKSVVALSHPTEEDRIQNEITNLKSIIPLRKYNCKDATTYYDVSLFSNQYGLRSIGLGCKQLMTNFSNSLQNDYAFYKSVLSYTNEVSTEVSNSFEFQKEMND